MLIKEEPKPFSEFTNDMESMEMFLPKDLDDLKDIKEKGEADHVDMSILFFNHSSDKYHCEEYKTLEGMIRMGYKVSNIEKYIKNGLIRIVSMKGRE